MFEAGRVVKIVFDPVLLVDIPAFAGTTPRL